MVGDMASKRAHEVSATMKKLPWGMATPKPAAESEPGWLENKGIWMDDMTHWQDDPVSPCIELEDTRSMTSVPDMASTTPPKTRPQLPGTVSPEHA